MSKVKTEEHFHELLETESEWEGDNVWQGLQIIAKYSPASLIEGAEHDKIYSVSLSELVDARITVEDAKELGRLNWMEDEGYLACFV